MDIIEGNKISIFYFNPLRKECPDSALSFIVKSNVITNQLLWLQQHIKVAKGEKCHFAFEMKTRTTRRTAPLISTIDFQNRRAERGQTVDCSLILGLQKCSIYMGMFSIMGKKSKDDFLIFVHSIN